MQEAETALIIQLNQRSREETRADDVDWCVRSLCQQEDEETLVGLGGLW